MFLDHTQRRTTVGRTPLDEWSACCRDLYLTTHNSHNRQTSMPPVGFEPTISAGGRPQTYALDRAATGTGVDWWLYTLSAYVPFVVQSAVHSRYYWNVNSSCTVCRFSWDETLFRIQISRFRWCSPWWFHFRIGQNTVTLRRKLRFRITSTATRVSTGILCCCCSIIRVVCATELKHCTAPTR